MLLFDLCEVLEYNGYMMEFDKLKTKMLKYIVFKKRTESEIRQKFADVDENLLEELIEHLKELEYIDDNKYIDKSVREFMRLKNLSMKELKYKLMNKGLKGSLIQNYIDENKEELLEYEEQSARNIIRKKIKTDSKEEVQAVVEHLRKKGYNFEIVKEAIRGVEFE